MIATKKWVKEQLNELRQWVREFLQGEVSRYVDVVLRQRKADELWELAFDLRNRHDALVAHLGLVETEPRLIPSGYRPQVVNAEFITPKKPVRKGR